MQMRLVLTLLAVFGALTLMAGEYRIGRYWKPVRIGSRDFYVVEHGNYNRDRPERERPFREAGIFPLMKPASGNWNGSIRNGKRRCRRSSGASATNT